MTSRRRALKSSRLAEGAADSGEDDSSGRRRPKLTPEQSEACERAFREWGGSSRHRAKELEAIAQRVGLTVSEGGGEAQISPTCGYEERFKAPVLCSSCL